MNRRALLQRISHAAIGVGATAFLPNCATTGGSGGGNLPPSTKENPFINSLGMKFVPVPGTNILMCTTETTVAQYQAAGLRTLMATNFSQAADHPVVFVSWTQAKSWCGWLSQREGKMYRLPTEKEWLAAAGGMPFPWGHTWPPPINATNCAGQELRAATESERQFMQMRADLLRGFPLIAGFSDRHKFTAPVMAYAPNFLGIHELGGNVGEFCEDKSSGERVVHGGSWVDNDQKVLRTQHRIRRSERTGMENLGFRCVIA